MFARHGQSISRVASSTMRRSDTRVVQFITRDLCSSHAGPSRHCYAAFGAADPAVSRKGKERAIEGGPVNLISLGSTSLLRPYSWRNEPLAHQRRYFHATSRREALPLVPAFIGILKSTSVLTVVTALSRVIISFFPIGTLAAFKMTRGVRWLASEDQKPDVGTEAEEFWKMWCQDEKGIRPNTKEAREILHGKPLPHGGLATPDGRISYPTPRPPGRFKSNRDEMYITNPALAAQRNNVKKSDERWLVSIIKRTRFFPPDLPPAALPYYEALSPQAKMEVDSLRRYWISLRVFKDGLRTSRILLSTLLLLPFLLVFGTYACGLERVPLTGRWRIILLTPEEEDKISSSLAGANWYRSVITLLTTPERPAPPIVPYDDWRWRWVEGILRRLESAALAECHGEPSPYGPPSIPVPPSTYPLKPRPRVSTMLHASLPGSDAHSGKEHLEIGPPYSLMIMDKDERNAFSYGFGGKGAGGIVVYTGLLDSILNDGSEPVEEPVKQPSGFFGSLFSAAPPRPTYSLPTEKQTLHLACVLAHEMGHLLLSHHLETLSQQQVLWPSILGLSMDLTRAFIWPFTFFLGPTVNDALANVGRTSAEEMSDRYGQIGFQWKHEYEADLAGLRILALAGFDPKSALDHFSASVADLHEIQQVEDRDQSLTGRFFKLWTRATHPTPEQRTEAIQVELDRWLKEAEIKA